MPVAIPAVPSVDTDSESDNYELVSDIGNEQWQCESLQAVSELFIIIDAAVLCVSGFELRTR